MIVNDLRWVVNDRVEPVHQVLGLHEVEVHDDGSPFGLHVDHVVGLVSEQGDPHHGNPMIDSLIDSIGPTVSDEGSGLGVTF